MAVLIVIVVMMMCSIVGGAGPAHAADEIVPARTSPRLRATTAELRSAMAMASARSSTFRQLAGKLESSDLIVHIVPGRPAWAEAQGQLRFVGTRGGVRYLRIEIDDNMPLELLAGLIGHELYHAYEVARATDVRDQASFKSLYEQIGVAGCAGQWPTCYDTAAARRAGWQVAHEVIIPAAIE